MTLRGGGAGAVGHMEERVIQGEVGAAVGFLNMRHGVVSCLSVSRLGEEE